MKKTVIIIENNVNFDGSGDYSHCLDILKAALNNTNLSDYVFIPVIKTPDDNLRKTAENDFKSLGITEYYIGDYNDFDKDTPLDQKLKPVYERADQVIEISTFFAPNQRRFLKPGTTIKSIYEHEKLGTGTYTKPGWEIQDKTHPTFTSCLGLSPIAQGIKIEEVHKKTPAEFFSTLQSQDTEFAQKLLEKTNSNNFAEFTENNTFLHAYFNKFDYINGFSIFLALVTANSMHKSINKDIVVHLSSGTKNPLQEYIDQGVDKRTKKPKEGSGISLLSTIFAECLPDVDVKQIEFYGPEGEFETGEDSKSYIYPINPKGTRTIRVFSEFLSKQSYQSIYDAAEMVGVSGDNSFEASVAHGVLPFYHSTNWGMKKPTFQAIKSIVETVDFGFTPAVKKDLILYFSYESLETRLNYWKELLKVDLDEIRHAWPKIANYLKENKNFYHVYEEIIKMVPPNIVLQQQSFFATKPGTTNLVDNLENRPKK